MQKGTERFFVVYANVPIEERKLPIVMLDDQPVSWNIAYEEITNKTEKGKKILKILKDLKII